MTDAEIDALAGVELRRAVVEAVGWKFRPDRFNGGFNWNDALAACKVAGCNCVSVTFGSGIIVDGCFSEGDTPMALCRALLKALAAKGGAA